MSSGGGGKTGGGEGDRDLRCLVDLGLGCDGGGIADVEASDCAAGMDITLALGGAGKDAERDLVSLGVRLAMTSAALSTFSCLTCSMGGGGGGDSERLILAREGVREMGGG